MANKKVIVHAGAPKTGTSALQAFFSANEGILKKSGVAYPYAEPASVIGAGVCAGNLAQMLHREGFVSQHRKRTRIREGLHEPAPKKSTTRIAFVPDAEFYKKLKDVIEAAEEDTVLLSGELFVSMTLEQMKLFKTIIADVFDVHVILFVRDVFEFLSSAWRQVLKRAGYAKTFDTYCTNVLKRDQGIPMIHGFDRLREAGLSVTVINYDTYRKDIASAFLDVAGIKLAEPAQYQLSDDRHNRSLTPTEAILVQKINHAYAGTGFPATFVRMLMNDPAKPKGSSKFYVKELHQMVLDQCRETLQALNDGIIGDPLSLEVRDAETVEPQINAADIDILLDVFKRMATFKQRRLKTGNLLAKVMVRVRHRFVPWDFNPEAYLLLNEDVAEAKQNPYVHYALFGRFEGRQYKYM